MTPMTQGYIDMLYFLGSLGEPFVTGVEDEIEELEGTRGWWDGFCRVRYA
jgi:hypothetical protein